MLIKLYQSIILLALISSCSHGTKINDADLSNIVVGKSSKLQIRERFGNPISAQSDPLGSCDYYMFTNSLGSSAQNTTFCYNKKGILREEPGRGEHGNF
jgi:outer membrane protein assembly factor BamE (lipoprotein component of BamABCDE complex)